MYCPNAKPSLGLPSGPGGAKVPRLPSGTLGQGLSGQANDAEWEVPLWASEIYRGAQSPSCIFYMFLYL